MDKLGLNLDYGCSTTDQKQTNPQESRCLSIQRCIQSLVHVCQCRDANCRLPSCPRMKRVVKHAKSCKRKMNGACPLCKQLVALCCYHAKHCQETKCPVPFCSNVKHKLRQRNFQEKLQQVRLLRRRIATVQSQDMSVQLPQLSLGSLAVPNRMSPVPQPHYQGMERICSYSCRCFKPSDATVGSTAIANRLPATSKNPTIVDEGQQSLTNQNESVVGIPEYGPVAKRLRPLAEQKL